MTHRRVDLIPVGHIGHECRRVPTDASNLVGNRAQVRLIEVDERDVRPVCGETQRDRASDSLTRPGDQCHFAFDTHQSVSFGEGF